MERKRIEEEERKKKEAEERKLRWEDDSKSLDFKNTNNSQSSEYVKRGIDDEEEEKKKKKKKDSDDKAEAEEEEKKAKEADGEEEEEVKPKEDEWKPHIPEHPSKICWAYYSSQDTFWLSMDDYDAGYLYECRFLDEATKARMPAEKVDEAFKTVPVVRSDLTHTEDVPLTFMIQE